jgi:hypothetical protein
LYGARFSDHMAWQPTQSHPLLPRPLSPTYKNHFLSFSTSSLSPHPSARAISLSVRRQSETRFLLVENYLSTDCSFCVKKSPVVARGNLWNVSVLAFH